MLDKSEGLEVALRAEAVAEATPISGKILPLPASLDFVEGIMHLREDVIPIINLKKRLGLADDSYGEEAKVAVVRLFHRRYGLLFDDIKEVFGAAAKDVQELDQALQTDDKIISALIAREKGKRTVELMDLSCLFAESSVELEKAGAAFAGDKGEFKEKTYSSFVVFTFQNQQYGVPVACAQEITFLDSLGELYDRNDSAEPLELAGSIDVVFKHGDIDGTLKLRGRTIPVLHAGRILGSGKFIFDNNFKETSRVLVLAGDGCHVAMIVEQIKAIEAIPDDEIMPMHGVATTGRFGVSGIYQGEGVENITLLSMEDLVCDRLDELKAMSRLSDDFEESEDTAKPVKAEGAHHLITENCYLIFGIGKNMAIQLKDVQEIIEKEGVLHLPGDRGFRSGVINLRGDVVPVVNLRNFFEYEGRGAQDGQRKLVICRDQSRIVALEVDSIVTIYKQEQYQATSSLNRELAGKEDVLDRLIVFEGDSALKEHVLVLNVHNLIRNHIDVATV